MSSSREEGEAPSSAGHLDPRPFIASRIQPVNAVYLFTTSILIPVLDFLRPLGPLLLGAAALAVAGFAVVLLLKLLGRPARNPLSTGTVAIAGLCAGMFAVAAVANTRNADEGGLLASKIDSVKAFQQALFRIEQKIDNQTKILTELREGKGNEAVERKIDQQTEVLVKGNAAVERKIEQQTKTLSKGSETIERKIDQQARVLTDIRDGKSDDPRVALEKRGYNGPHAVYAVEHADVVAVELMYKVGRPPPLVHSATGTLALGVPIAEKHPDISRLIEILAAKGADLNQSGFVAGQLGRTSSARMTELSRQLPSTVLSNGTSIYYPSTGNLSAPPVVFAAWFRNEAALVALLKAGVSLDVEVVAYQSPSKPDSKRVVVSTAKQELQAAGFGDRISKAR